MTELTSNYEKEKNMYKKRIAEIEKNLRDAEGKKGSLLLEYEKEKAKWNIEKDNLESKYSELNDKYKHLENKNESLLRENEKLRNEKNMLRRAGATTTGRYTLMLREGGNTLGSSLINNLGFGKNNSMNINMNQGLNLNKGNIKKNINSINEVLQENDQNINNNIQQRNDNE